MKPRLNCEIVHDLLPLYVEGLTAPGTAAAVEEHLAGCPNCRAARAAMAEDAPPPAQENQKEVDYLKQVRKKGRLRVVLAVCGTLLVLLAAVAVKNFWIGSEATRSGLSWSARSSDGKLELHAFTHSDRTAYRNWQVKLEQGAYYITARKIIASPLCRDTDYNVVLDVSDVEQVYLCDTLLWEDGVTIFESNLDAYAAQTSYVGSAPAVGEVLRVLRVADYCGGFTFQLETEAEPYGLKLYFSEIYTPEGMVDLNRQMERLAPRIIALIGNLSRVSWCWQTDNGTFTACVTKEAADAAFVQGMQDMEGLPDYEAELRQKHQKAWQEKGVKWGAESPSAYQTLYNLIEDGAVAVPELTEVESWPEEAGFAPAQRPGADGTMAAKPAA